MKIKSITNTVGVQTNSGVQTPDNHVTVSEYLTKLNTGLKEYTDRIIGEVCDLKLYPGRSYLYFSIKDKEDGAMLNCFMWRRAYTACGVDLEDGMEIIIYGYPKVYEPNGSLSFQTETVELVGEGALKKAYDKLKLKLEKEGLFNVERKRPILPYPLKIGVITSRDGAVLSDLRSNLGKFGYKLTFVNSRVEGQIAIHDLIDAVSTLKKQDIDVLVIMRGGGSLEAFQAFNNELLVRSIVDFPVPVIAGIGHDKDICLVSLAADAMVSTPTAVAHLLNESWEQALSKVKISEQDMMNQYGRLISDTRSYIDRMSASIKERFSSILEKFKRMSQAFILGVNRIAYRIREEKTFLDTSISLIRTAFEHSITHTTNFISSKEKQLQYSNPEEQLKRGYSIVRLRDMIIKTIKTLQKGDPVVITVYDGSAEAEITSIK